MPLSDVLYDSFHVKLASVPGGVPAAYSYDGDFFGARDATRRPIGAVLIQGATMLVTAEFYRNGLPAEGLTPTLTVYDLSDGSTVLSGVAMGPVGGPFYAYIFADDPAKSYGFLCDGGITLSGNERYTAFTSGSYRAIQEIKVKTDNLPLDPASQSQIEAALEATEIAIGEIVLGIKAKTDNLPLDPASQSQIETALTNFQLAITAIVEAIKASTDHLPVDPASQSQTEVALSALESAMSELLNVHVSLAIPAAVIEEALTPGVIPCRRASTLRITLTGIGTLTGRDKLWFTVKTRDSQDDPDALIQIEESDGLLRVNGAEAETPGNASVTVDDEEAGDITIYIHQAETLKLQPFSNAVYDVKIRKDGDTRPVTEGRFPISETVTRAI